MSQDRVLSEEVFKVLRRIIHAIDSNSRNLVKEYGLTGAQLSILKELSQSGETPVGALAKNINLSHATVTDILDRLEKRQFIQRTRSAIDKRRVFVSVTQLGRDVLQQTPSGTQEHLKEEFEKLHNWEKSLLLSSLQRIAAMLERQTNRKGRFDKNG